MDHGGNMAMGNGTAPAKKKMVMHMALYWGKDAWVLFANWPGNSLGQYILSLIVTFLGAVLVEYLNICRFKLEGRPILEGFLQAVIYGVRMFFSYNVMLAVMSFNFGILFAAVIGNGVGHWLFETRSFRKTPVESTLKEGGLCC
ncbi:unnamed protein product [Victoria cruziana]